MSDSPLYTWRGAVTDCQNLKSTTKHVLLTIACHMNGRGEGSYPTIDQLVYESGLSNRTICTHIQLAVEAGWIRIKKHGFAGQKWANHEYEPASPDSYERVTYTQAKLIKKGSELDEKVVNLTTEGSEPVAEGSEPVAEGSEPNDTKVVKEVHSSSTYSNSISNPNSSTEVKRPAHDYEKTKVEFETKSMHQFLALYPKNPRYKTEFRRQWWDQGCEDITSDILQKLKVQLSQCAEFESAKFLQSAESYLSDRKWENKIVPIPTNKPKSAARDIDAELAEAYGDQTIEGKFTHG